MSISHPSPLHILMQGSNTWKNYYKLRLGSIIPHIVILQRNVITMISGMILLSLLVPQLQVNVKESHNLHLIHNMELHHTRE